MTKAPATAGYGVSEDWIRFGAGDGVGEAVGDAAVDAVGVGADAVGVQPTTSTAISAATRTKLTP